MKQVVVSEVLLKQLLACLEFGGPEWERDAMIKALRAAHEPLIQPNYVRLEPYVPNEQGSTLCTVRWMAETVRGWVGAYHKEALEQLVIKPECEAVQASDQMVCKCGNGWDVNDSHSPPCKATSHSYDLAAIKHAVVQELEYAKRTGVTSNISPITQETLLQMCLDLEKYKAKGLV